MPIKFILPIVLAALAGACAQAGCPASCLEGAIQYSNAPPASGGPARVVQVAIDSTFTLYERTKIFRAVNEWNTVLNGQVRLDVSPDDHGPAVARAAGSAQLPRWAVVKIDSSNAMLGAPAMKRTLALTVGTRRATVFVVADRIGSRDLTGIMMHEFGHAFGVSHDSGSALMHPFYTGDKQRCIDKGAARAVALSQNLSLDGLNWCGGDTLNIAERTADSRRDNGRQATAIQAHAHH